MSRIDRILWPDPSPYGGLRVHPVESIPFGDLRVYPVTAAGPTGARCPVVVATLGAGRNIAWSCCPGVILFWAGPTTDSPRMRG